MTTNLLNVIWSVANLILFVLLFRRLHNVWSERRNISSLKINQDHVSPNREETPVQIAPINRQKPPEIIENQVEQEQLEVDSIGTETGHMHHPETEQSWSEESLNDESQITTDRSNSDILTSDETQINTKETLLGETIPDDQPIEFQKSSDEAPDTDIPSLSSRGMDQLIQLSHEDRLSTFWNIVGASVQGTSHVAAKLPCQDYHDYRVISNQTIIAAVADGLGSATQSHKGAKLAVEAALTSISTALTKQIPNQKTDWVDVFKASFSEARKTLEEIAQTENQPLREYGTTLIVGVLNDEWLVTGHIGDGAVVAMFEDKTLSTVCAPQNNEYINQVVPLTKPDALDMVEYQAQKARVTAMAMFSDGIQHLSIRNLDNAPHPPFFQVMFDPLTTTIDQHNVSKQLADYLTSDQVCSKTDDDKTLLLIGRMQPGSNTEI